MPMKRAATCLVLACALLAPWTSSPWGLAAAQPSPVSLRMTPSPQLKPQRRRTLARLVFSLPRRPPPLPPAAGSRPPYTGTPVQPLHSHFIARPSALQSISLPDAKAASLPEDCASAFSQALTGCEGSPTDQPTPACCAGLRAAGGDCLRSVLGYLQAGNPAAANGL